MPFVSVSGLSRKALFVVTLILGLTIVAGSFLLDAPIQQFVLHANLGHWSKNQLVAAASRYGDWPELMLAGVLGYLAARRLRNVRWQRILISAMIASTIAGMTVNLSRLTTGRTRPRAEYEQGWYGLRHGGKWLIGKADFNSFPSGHTATAVGFAGVILFSAPSWGIPAMIAALAVATSRILLGAHHPSDVVTAVVLSLLIAWLVCEFFMRRFPLEDILQRRHLRHWLNIWRLLIRRSHQNHLNKSPVRVIIYDDFNPHFANWLVALGPGAPVWYFIRNVREVLLVDSLKDPRIANPMYGDCKTVFLPLREDQISNTPKGFYSLTPRMDALEIFSCKATTNLYLDENGFSRLHPKTYSDPAQAEYPCILKRTNLYGGGGIETVRSQKKLQKLLKKDLWQHGSYVIQSYVPGLVEYTTHMVCKGGRILWHCTYVMKLSKEGGMRPWGATSDKVTASAEQLKQMEAILAPLEYSGPCNIDYKTDDEGNIIVFEVNPRMGGNIMRPEKIDDLRETLSTIIDAALTTSPER